MTDVTTAGDDGVEVRAPASGNADGKAALVAATRSDHRRCSFSVMISPPPLPISIGNARERFGKRCKKLRRRAGLSQLDMVREHGFSLSHYQKIERDTLDPRPSTSVRIAKSFGISVSELVTSL